MTPSPFPLFLAGLACVSLAVAGCSNAGFQSTGAKKTQLAEIPTTKGSKSAASTAEKDTGGARDEGTQSPVPGAPDVGSSVMPTPPSSPGKPADVEAAVDPFAQPTTSTQPPAAAVPDIVFGSTEEGVYHVGDGGFTGDTSGCISRLQATDVVGTSFEFHFRLEGPPVVPLIQIGEICGVSAYRDSNYSKVLIKNSTGQTVFTGYLSFLDNGKTKSYGWSDALPAGDYSLVVLSRFDPPGPDFPGAPNGDYDDFLVGKIGISAKDTKVTRLGVITRDRNGAIVKQMP